MNPLDAVHSLVAQASALRDLPSSAHLLAGAAVVVGLLLWLWGKKLLKLGFALLGIVGGAFIGFFLVPTIAPATVAGVPTPYLGLGLGAVLGLIQGLVLFRYSMAISAAIIFGLGATLGAAAWLQFEPLKGAAEVAKQPVSSFTPITPESLGRRPEGQPASPSESPTGHADPRTPVIDQLRPAAEKAEAFLSELGGRLRDEWRKLQPRQQTTMVVSGLGGVLVGLVLGLLFPKRASALVTSLLGAAVWLPGAAWLMVAFDAPGAGSLNQSAMVWLIVWLAVAALGTILQLTVMSRKAPKEG